jgi:hypothetical protein
MHKDLTNALPTNEDARAAVLRTRGYTLDQVSRMMRYDSQGETYHGIPRTPCQRTTVKINLLSFEARLKELRAEEEEAKEEKARRAKLPRLRNAKGRFILVGHPEAQNGASL